MDAILKQMDANVGDLLLFIADKDEVVFQALGNWVGTGKKADLIPTDQYDLYRLRSFHSLNTTKKAASLKHLIHLAHG